MKVINYNNRIINCDDNDPQLTMLIAKGAEELPIDMFDGLAQYANNTNTEYDEEFGWVFDPTSIEEKLVEDKAKSISLLEDQLIKLTQDKATAIELNLTTKSESIQAEIDTIISEITLLTT